MKDNSRKIFDFFEKYVLGAYRSRDWLPGYGESFDERFAALPKGERDTLRRRAVGGAQLMVMALLTGIITGVAASVLKYAIDFVSTTLTGSFHTDGFNYVLLALPVVGILLAATYQRYILRKPIYHGEYRMYYDIKYRRVYLPVELTYAPLLASTITLGFGGSAGSEGPIAYSGAAIGSNVGSFFRISPRRERILMAIGAGAGIAGIFKAPIGGALFTLEVMGVAMSTVGVIALVIACVASALTAYFLSGCTPDIAFVTPGELIPRHIPLMLLFGLVCGIYSIYYSSIMSVIAKGLKHVGNHWVKNIVAGLLVGVCLFCFPGLYGEGYNLVGQLLNNDMAGLTDGGLASMSVRTPLLILALSFGIMLCKPAATSATNNGGGVAGDFAPTIMAGSVVGFFFAYLLNTYFGMELSTADYVYMGMAGILSGACRAPLMSMFLITEMATIGYGQFMPVAIVATFSYLTVCLLRLLRHKSNRVHRPEDSTRSATR